MSEENVEIVRRIYEAAAGREAASIFALYDPEVELDATRLGVGDQYVAVRVRSSSGIPGAAHFRTRPLRWTRSGTSETRCSSPFGFAVAVSVAKSRSSNEAGTS